MGRMSDDEATTTGHSLYADDHAAQALGLVLDEVGPGRARLSMAVRQDMINGHGICHGGLIFTLADTAFAYACNSRGPSVAAHCTINFLAPARLGERLSAVATEAALEGRSGIYDVAVTNQAGATIALFRGVSRRLKEGARA
jgi:acyl-CoA thioesterase